MWGVTISYVSVVLMPLLISVSSNVCGTGILHRTPVFTAVHKPLGTPQRDQLEMFPSSKDML